MQKKKLPVSGIMWLALVLTIPTIAYLLLNVFDETSIISTIPEHGYFSRLNISTFFYLVIPIIAMLLTILARILLESGKKQYSLYPVKTNMKFYNDILTAYLVALIAVLIAYTYYW